MKKIGILGISYLQRPLILEAKRLGYETHVFGWEKGNVIKDICDFYYPISIMDTGELLKKCREIEIDAILTIASDASVNSVNIIADKLGLVGNSLETSKLTTNKFLMRKQLMDFGFFTPLFGAYKTVPIDIPKAMFPAIVKPIDLSGSRGVSMVYKSKDLKIAVEKALDLSFQKTAIIEQFVQGSEYSVEFISYQGKHYPIAITRKITSGPLYFIEIEHHQPSGLPEELESRIFLEVEAVLGVFGIENGASHTEVIICENGQLFIVELASRMGGELIGSHLVEMSTGFNFLKGVIDVALGIFNPETIQINVQKLLSGVLYKLSESGRIIKIEDLTKPDKRIRECILISKVGDQINGLDTDTSCRVAVMVYQNETIIHTKDVVDSIVCITSESLIGDSLL